MDDDNVIELRDYQPVSSGVHPGEQHFYDDVARAIAIALEDGLTAGQIVGTLYFATRRFSEQADEW